MPKIIDNIRENLVKEARHVMLETNTPLTVRNVAKTCGIAVGTFYNYFESKEFLMAMVMLEDWNKLMDDLSASTKGMEPHKAVKLIYDGIRDFTHNYRRAWSESDSTAFAMQQRTMRHKTLVSQIKAIIEGFLTDATDPYLTEFLAEIIIKFGADDVTPFDDFDRMLTKLLN